MGKRSAKFKSQTRRTQTRKAPAKVKAKTKSPALPKPPNKSIKGKPPAKLDMRGRRWYTDAERCIIMSALKANGGNVALTAAEQGIPYLTLYCWSVGRRCPEALQLQKEYDERMELALNEVAWQAVALFPERMDKAPLNHLVLVMDKSIEKARLLRGQSTSSTDSRNTNVTQSAELARLAENFARMPESDRLEFKRLVAKLSGVVEPVVTGGAEGPRAALSDRPPPADADEVSPLLT